MTEWCCINVIVFFLDLFIKECYIPNIYLLFHFICIFKPFIIIQYMTVDTSAIYIIYIRPLFRNLKCINTDYLLKRSKIEKRRERKLIYDNDRFDSMSLKIYLKF